MFKNIVLSFIILCSLNFYNFLFLGKSVKVFQLLAIGIIIGLYLIYFIYDTSPAIKKNFTPYIWLILLSIPGSMIIASLYHDQSLGLTAYEQRGMYFYFLYFLLPILKPKPQSIERLFFVFGFIFMIVYLLQYIMYPTVILDTRVFEDRETIRMGIPGTTYVLLSYFFSLHFILKKEKWYYIVYCMMAVTVLVMMGGRQIIFYTVIMTIGVLLFNHKIKSKVLLFILIFIVFIPVYFLLQNIFNEIMAVNQDQKAEGLENVRVRAAIFFLTDVFPNNISYILGNGISNNRSAYGQMMTLYSLSYGFNLSDIGIIGNYVSYGLIFVVGVIALLVKILKIKIEERFRYLKYFYIMTLALIFLGRGFEESEFIVPLCLCLYLFDVSVMNLKNKANEEADEEDILENLKTHQIEQHGDQPVYNHSRI